MTILNALKDDARRMEDIACECAPALREPYHNDDGKTQRFLWAMAVAILHLLTAEIKRGERK